MFLWILALLLIATGAKSLFSDLDLGGRVLASRREDRALSEASLCFQEIQETFEAGLVPPATAWERLSQLRAPWGELASESLKSLREQGGSLLPTLKRLRSFAEDHRQALADARARSAQAMAQALVCAGLVPTFGVALYFLLPAVSERPWAWLSACALAILGAGAGAVWMLSMAEAARWGGLSTSRRSWVLSAQCAAERLLALIRSGSPSDLAWVKTTERVALQCPELGIHWGHSVWKSGSKPENLPSGTARVIAEAGIALRKSIQLSLAEGRPCTERIEAVVLGFRRDIRAEIERKLGLLPAQALKPLFLCVAPSLIGLLGFALYLGMGQIPGLG